MAPITLAYGREGLIVDLPEPVDRIEPRYVPGLPDEAAALRDALRRPIASPPLADLVKPGDSVITPHPKTSGGARWNYLAA